MARTSLIAHCHVQQSFHHKFREDTLASTAIPSLGGYGVAELEPFESQQRGFEHGHRKKYSIPKVRDVPCQTVPDRPSPLQPLTFIDRALGRPSPQPLTFIDRVWAGPAPKLSLLSTGPGPAWPFNLSLLLARLLTSIS